MSQPNRSPEWRPIFAERCIPPIQTSTRQPSERAEIVRIVWGKKRLSLGFPRGILGPSFPAAGERTHKQSSVRPVPRALLRDAGSRPVRLWLHGCSGHAEKLLGGDGAVLGQEHGDAFFDKSVNDNDEGDEVECELEEAVLLFRTELVEDLRHVHQVLPSCVYAEVVEDKG
eukprot:TRINITY_DN4655_c0_g1_i1.p1 TRINITY_DN4655_c0_g1~~TRINITY_DN4655_c0_g1_i1.p1  ORF type:complete len:171 (+),score=23.94 TRINITY_DN4655_c0_g1_i1:576-1088(+)